MKTATLFFGLSALLSATFVFAQPTATTVEKRCSACDEACPKNHFYYHPKSCCLQNGGPPTTNNPPTGTGCPKDWYWHPQHSCCTPKTKPKFNYPNPTCDSTTFSNWNPSRQCCEHKNPGGPQPSQVVGGKKYKKSIHSKKAVALKAREENLCPTEYEQCAIPGAEGEYECVHPSDVKACGGCPSSGKGQDCTAIPGALNVACESNPSTMVSTCKINSCEDGYAFSKDRSSCVPTLVSQ